MITWGSRFRRELAYMLEDPRRGDSPIEVASSHVVSSDLVVRREHRVVEGERLDLLAQRYYGDPLKFWLICDANDEIFPEDLMVPGRIIRIPRNRG